MDRLELLGHEAAGYALAGWPVFPLVPNGKVPLYASPHPKGSEQRRTCRGECGKYGHGVLDATCNLDIVRAWWGRTPRANVAIATGYPGPDVVDVDTKDGRPGLATWERVRRAGYAQGSILRVRTASGGYHMYYEGTQQRNSTMAKLGLDFRSLGGYVVAAPSRVGDGHYLIEKIFEHPLTANTVDWEQIRDHLSDKPRYLPSEYSGVRHGGYEQLIDWLGEQSEGNRNAGLYWVAARMHEHGADRGDWMHLETVAQSLGLDLREVQQTIASAGRAPDNGKTGRR